MIALDGVRLVSQHLAYCRSGCVDLAARNKLVRNFGILRLLFRARGRGDVEGGRESGLEGDRLVYLVYLNLEVREVNDMQKGTKAYVVRSLVFDHRNVVEEGLQAKVRDRKYQPKRGRQWTNAGTCRVYK